MERRARQSNIELLRIFAMLIIIGHHFALYGGLGDCTEVYFVNRVWIQFLMISGKLGVSLFVLISGFFLIKMPKLRMEKLIKLWLQVFFWSVLAYVVYCVIVRYAGNADVFRFPELVKNCFPIVNQHWWFASTYFVLYLFSPFLNRYLLSLDKTDFQRLLILMSVCWCLIPTLLGRTFECNHLLWFFYLYSLAAYIRLYGVEEAVPCSGVGCAIGAILLAFAVLFCIDRVKIIYLNMTNYRTGYDYLMGESGEQRLMLLIMAVSLLLFVGFLKISIRTNRIINTISSATFGIYLIHDNQYIRSIHWYLINRGKEYSMRPVFIPYSVGVMAAVFIACMLIELMRIQILEKHYLKAVKRIGRLVENRLDSSRLME